MSVIATTEFGRLRKVTRDGAEGVLFECRCGEWGGIDDDQYHGRVSVDHASMGCPVQYHETHDFAAAAELSGWVTT